MANSPRTAKRGVVSSAFAGLASIAANILLFPLVIATVGAGPYGVWLLLIAIATYLHYADLGVGSAIVHFTSRTRGGAESTPLGSYLSAGLVWNLAIAFAVVPAYLAIAHLYVGSSGPGVGISPQDSMLLVVVGAVATLSFVIKPFSSALIGAGLLPVERTCQLAGVIVRIAGTVIACFFVGTIAAVAVAETLALLTPPIGAIVMLRRHKLGRVTWNRETLSTLQFMLSYSTRAFGVTAVGALLLQGGTFVVAAVGGPADVTHFNAAFRIYGSIRQLMTWLLDPFRSALSRLFASDRRKADDTLLALAAVTLVTAVLGCGTLVLMSPSIVQLWLGSEVPVTEVALTVSVLLVGLTLNAVHLPLAPAGDAAGRPGVFFNVQLAWLVSFLVLAFPLGAEFGIVGVALGLSLPLVVVEPLYMTIARRTINFDIGRWARRVLLPTVIACLGGVVPAVAVAFTLFGLGHSAFTYVTASAYFVGMLASLLMLRLRFPWVALRELSKTGL